MANAANAWPPEQFLRARLAPLIAHPKNHHPLVVAWLGTAYRFASLQFASRERFTDGEGARRNGGRLTPIGGPRTLYLSLDRATATAELDSWYVYYNLPDTSFQPRLLAAVAVSVGLLLDLSAPQTLDYFGLTLAHIAEEWRPLSDAGGVAPTQTFGRLVYEAGFEGVLFLSARREHGINLALFPDNFKDGSHGLMLNSD